jgi:hypothetical protein
MSEGLGYAPDHVFYALLGLTKETQLRGILGIQVRPSPTIFYLLYPPPIQPCGSSESKPRSNDPSWCHASCARTNF